MKNYLLNGLLVTVKKITTCFYEGWISDYRKFIYQIIESFFMLVIRWIVKKKLMFIIANNNWICETRWGIENEDLPIIIVGLLVRHINYSTIRLFVKTTSMDQAYVGRQKNIKLAIILRWKVSWLSRKIIMLLTEKNIRRSIQHWCNKLDRNLT